MALNLPISKKPRLENIDYLRGLSALSIMVYHYATWTLGEVSAKSFLGRIGIYGVAIFYILSGLTLSYVYRDSLEPTAKSLGVFFKKRAFRIFPLLWLATLASIALSKKTPSSLDVILNLTGGFGFIKWNTYFATGAWSIGNELVFYSLFPLLLFAFSRNRYLFYCFVSIILFFYLFFAFHVISPSLGLSLEWRSYTNPINQALFFVGGMILSLFFRHQAISRSTNTVLGLIGVGLLIFYPSVDFTTSLVTGSNRIVFSISCFLICLSFFKSNYRLPALLDQSLSFLGKSSYSVYLLHPIIFAVIKAIFNLITKHLFVLPGTTVLFTSITATLFTSYFVYEYFEKRFIKWGNEL